jgi:hypothetical protein
VGVAAEWLTEFVTADAVVAGEDMVEAAGADPKGGGSEPSLRLASTAQIYKKMVKDNDPEPL